MAVDQSIIDITTGNLLTGTAAGHLRRERFADAAASNIISGMNHILEKGRQTFSSVSDLILCRIAEDLTGQDDPSSERILTSRAVQFQPQEATMVDPNYRQPPPPPKPSGT